MRNKLISSLAGAAFSFAASGLAFAADIATKAPAPSPAPIYNWTGWYVGVNAGASFGTFKTDFNAPATFALFTSPVGPDIANVDFAGRDEVYPAGFIGGVQIGFNWQFSPLLVAGVEADFQGANEKEHSGPFTGNFSEFLILPGGFINDSVTGSTVLNYQTKIDWFGTVRGRIGYLFGDGAVLTYLTGGLAYGKVELDGTSTVSGVVNPPLPVTPFSATQAFDHSNVNTGWVVGTGTEGKLLIPGWTYKIEGLYMDLGHLDATGPGASQLTHVVPILPFGVTAGPVTTHTHFTDTILRVGLNYQFH